ncbi:MAG: hypothetical protein H6728_00085 [Myxococcales bacterium]|nr:hypothetical protein [Myxococcales bacterium]
MHQWRQIGLLGPFLVWLWLAACGTPTGTCEQDSQCKNGQRCIEKLCQCPEGTTRCNDACVDVLTDKANCGSCGKTCPTGSTCQGGQCLCPDDQVLCGGACVDLEANTSHCGNCGVTCKTGEKCAQGRCLANCPSLTPDACGNACVSFQTDARHCGTCGNACASGQICQNAQCACPSGQRACDKTCADIERDPANCGACGNACPSGQSCAIGECVQACPASRPTLCLGSCVDLSRDVEHCGKCGESCPEGQRCQDSRCSCPSGSTLCGGRCIDLQNNAQHCGACDNPCASGTVCAGGFCIPSCPAATSTTCLGGCVDTQTNPDHCGGCGKACKTGEVCQAGTCTCPTGFKLCDGVCIDVSINRLHCGACGQLCKAGEVCSEGNCVTTCPAKTSTPCDGGCFDVKQDARHCGACGDTCKAGFICIEGACSCPNEQTSCQGRCVDTKTDPRHCGKCGIICGSTEYCNAGVCTLQCTGTTTACTGGCVDTQTNAQHCGTCGNVCDSTQQCKGGKCVCGEGRADCGNNRCIDTYYNVEHCGACNNACEIGKLCEQAQCVCHPDGCPLVLQGKGTSQGDEGRFTHLLVGKNQELIYVMEFQGKITFAGKTFTGPLGTRSLAIFALKADASGLLWSVTEILGTQNTDGVKVKSVKQDNDGNLYFVGTFTNTATFGNIVLSPPQGQIPAIHGFLAKLDTQQQWAAAKEFRAEEIPSVNTIQVFPYSLQVSSQGDIFVAGAYAGRITLENNTVESSTPQLFVLHLDKNLTAQKLVSSTDATVIQRTNLLFDNKGHLFLTSSFEGSIKLGNTTLTPPKGQSNYNAISYIDFSKASIWQWSILAPRGNDDDVNATSDANEGVIINGHYYGAGQIGSTALPTSSDQKAYIASIDLLGQVRWYKTPISNGRSTGVFVNRTSSGRLLWVYTAYQESELDGLKTPAPNLGEPFAVVVAAMDDNGKALSLRLFPDTSILSGGFETAGTTFLLKEQTILLGGRIRGQVTFNGKTYTSTGAEEPFIFRAFLR